MLNSLSSCRKIGPFPRQHPFGITDLVQISGIESQQLGYKILAPRGLFTVVGSYRDSDIVGGVGGWGGGRYANFTKGQAYSTCGLRQDNQVVIEEDFLGLIFFWIYLISTLDSSSFSIFTIFLSLSLTCWGIYLQKKKLMKKLFRIGCCRSLRFRYELSHLRQKHHTTVNRSALRNRALYFIHRNSAMTALPPVEK